MPVNETAYQLDLIKKIPQYLPGAVVLKNDAKRIQGIPDLLVLYNSYWAMLEVKISASADIQPNQDWYIDMFNGMSFAAFIYPENEEEVLNALQQTFGAPR